MVLFRITRRPLGVVEVAQMATLVLSEPQPVFEPTVAAWYIAREAESTEL